MRLPTGKLRNNTKKPSFREEKVGDYEVLRLGVQLSTRRLLYRQLSDSYARQLYLQSEKWETTAGARVFARTKYGTLKYLAAECSFRRGPLSRLLLAVIKARITATLTRR